MDIDELKSYLDTRFEQQDAKFEKRFQQQAAQFEQQNARIEQRFEHQTAQFDAKLDEAFTRWAQHILNEVGTRLNETNNRLDSIDSRLKLQAGLIQSGARAMARFSEFAETSEQRWVALVNRVEELERKVGGK